MKYDLAKLMKERLSEINNLLKKKAELKTYKVPDDLDEFGFSREFGGFFVHADKLIGSEKIKDLSYDMEKPFRFPNRSLTPPYKKDSLTMEEIYNAIPKYINTSYFYENFKGLIKENPPSEFRRAVLGGGSNVNWANKELKIVNSDLICEIEGLMDDEILLGGNFNKKIHGGTIKEYKVHAKLVLSPSNKKAEELFDKINKGEVSVSYLEIMKQGDNYYDISAEWYYNAGTAEAKKSKEILEKAVRARESFLQLDDLANKYTIADMDKLLENLYDESTEKGLGRNLEEFAAYNLYGLGEYPTKSIFHEKINLGKASLKAGMDGVIIINNFQTLYDNKDNIIIYPYAINEKNEKVILYHEGYLKEFGYDDEI